MSNETLKCLCNGSSEDAYCPVHGAHLDRQRTKAHITYEEANGIANRRERFMATIYAINTLLLYKRIYSQEEFRDSFVEWVEKEVRCRKKRNSHPLGEQRCAEIRAGSPLTDKERTITEEWEKLRHIRHVESGRKGGRPRKKYSTCTEKGEIIEHLLGGE
jgi:hypothetical protein